MKRNNIQLYLNRENTCLAIPRKYSTCLLKENYLSEFDTEEEKELAMENLLLLDEVPTKDSKRLVNSGDLANVLENLENGINSNIENLSTEIGDINEEIEGINEEIGDIKDNINTIETNVSNLEINVNDILNEVNSLNIEIFNKYYDPENFSGMGKIYLLKNIVNGINLLVLNMLEDDEGNPLTHTIFVIQYDYYLDDKIIHIPSNCVLWFEGGSLNEGTLVGDDTIIIAAKTEIFSNIIIDGTWNVPEITTAWFSDANENNGLKNVFALQDENVLNKIVIEEGDYIVSVSTEGESVLECLSNLDLYVLGNVRLQANSLKSYCNILCNNASNITISGSGCIIGDKDTHIGTEGEHGMGIGIYNSKFITIKDITIKDCWGDCIYIGGKTIQPENIIIDNVNLDNGRRQGISVVNGENISITNSRITNVKGTNPQAAIDIEPNEGQSVSNIYISNIYVKDCEKGIVIYKNKSFTKETIVIDNCNIDCTAIGISLSGINTSVTVSNNSIKTKYVAIVCNNRDIDPETTLDTDNIMLFVNNMICQTDIPEEGSEYAVYMCSIRTPVGNYEYNHNIIKSVLPVFQFARGTKRIIENNITCPTLFDYYQSHNNSVVGNTIIGNISIPGKNSIIDKNRITGTIESTTERTEIDDSGSRITNNIISDPTEGGSLFESGSSLYITNNRFANIRFHITGDGGYFNNNIVDYTTNYKHNGGIILNFSRFDFIGNTVTYKGTSLINPETDEPYPVYLVRARNNVNNTISIYRDMRCIFYTGDENSNVAGNILLFKVDTSSEVQHVATVDFIVPTANVGHVQPVYKNAGSTAERPTFPIGENYYIGCRYFDTSLDKTILWDGTRWIDEKGFTANISKGTYELAWDLILNNKLNFNDIGYEFYIVELEKPVYYSLEKLYEYNVRLNYVYESNLLTENNTYYVEVSNSSEVAASVDIYFSKVNDNPIEEDLIPITNNSHIIAPDPSVYPYIYINGINSTRRYIRIYTPTWVESISNSSDTNRIILRKNIVNGENILTLNMINQPNKIYVVQYDFKLPEETVLVITANLTQKIIIGNKRYYYSPTLLNINLSENLNKILKVGEAINSDRNVAYSEGKVFTQTEDIYLAKSQDVSELSFNLSKEFTSSKNTSVIIDDITYYITNAISIPSGFTMFIPQDYYFFDNTGSTILEIEEDLYTNTTNNSINVCIGCTYDFTDVSYTIESPYIDNILAQETSINNNIYFYDANANAFNVLSGYTVTVPTKYVVLNSSGTGILFTPTSSNTNYTPLLNTAIRIGELASNYLNVSYTISDCIAIPENCTIAFEGGSINNGLLVGTDTSITAPKTAIFTNIVIDGTWNVPNITSAWFSDASNNDVLKQVFNLASELTYNEVTIEEGDYIVECLEDNKGALPTKSNTKYIILGNIHLKTNSFNSAMLINITNCVNVSIEGNGYLYGDKLTHIYYDGISHPDGYIPGFIQRYGDSQGNTITPAKPLGYNAAQNGHGIYMRESKNIRVEGINIRDCIGDGIDIGKNAAYVIIRNISIENTRRQGISIVGGYNVLIENISINTVKGTAPEMGIDIEPSKANQKSDRIIIRNVEIKNATLGVGITSRYDNKHHIVLQNLQVENVCSGAAATRNCKKVFIENCSFKATGRGSKVYPERIMPGINMGDVYLHNCTLDYNVPYLKDGFDPSDEDLVRHYEDYLTYNESERSASDKDINTLCSALVNGERAQTKIESCTITSNVSLLIWEGNIRLTNNIMSGGDIRSTTEGGHENNFITGNILSLTGILMANRSYICNNDITGCKFIYGYNTCISNNFINFAGTPIEGKTTFFEGNRMRISNNRIGFSEPVANETCLYNIPNDYGNISNNFINGITNLINSSDSKTKVYNNFSEDGEYNSSFVGDVRPINPAIGSEFFDTSLPVPKPIYYNGQYWTDCVGTRITWSIEYVLENLTATNKKQPTVGTAYGTRLKASNGYSLPSSVSVVMGGIELTSGVDYTYNNSNGNILNIGGESGVTGDLVITANGVLS